MKRLSIFHWTFQETKKETSMPNWSNIPHIIKVFRKVLLVQQNISPNYMRHGKQHQHYDNVTIKGRNILMKINNR